MRRWFANTAVATLVGTPMIFRPSYSRRSPRRWTMSSAVEPVPSPTTIPDSTRSAAARAARTFEGSRSLPTVRALPLDPLLSHRPPQKKGRQDGC